MIVGHVGVSTFPPLLGRRGGAIQRRIVAPVPLAPPA